MVKFILKKIGWTKEVAVISFRIYRPLKLYECGQLKLLDPQHQQGFPLHAQNKFCRRYHTAEHCVQLYFLL